MPPSTATSHAGKEGPQGPSRATYPKDGDILDAQVLRALRLVHLQVQQQPGQAVHGDVGHDGEGIPGGDGTAG